MQTARCANEQHVKQQLLCTSSKIGGCGAAEDKLLSRAGMDDAAAAVAGAEPPLAQAELGPLDAPQHHRQRLRCLESC